MNDRKDGFRYGQENNTESRSRHGSEEQLHRQVRLLGNGKP